MGKDGYHNIGIAKTLKELKVAIDKAIEISGEDAQWNGFDDHNIYIHSVSPNKKWSSIYSE